MEAQTSLDEVDAFLQTHFRKLDLYLITRLSDLAKENDRLSRLGSLARLIGSEVPALPGEITRIGDIVGISATLDEYLTIIPDPNVLSLEGSKPSATSD